MQRGGGGVAAIGFYAGGKVNAAKQGRKKAGTKDGAAGIEYLMAQVSIQATGRGGHFWDLLREEQVEGLAVAFHRRTQTGAQDCVLPAAHPDLVYLLHATRPQRRGQQGSGDSATADALRYLHGGG